MREYVKRRRNEKGSADIVVILLTIPLVIFLMLTMIDMSLYFEARTNVQNATRDAAREVAIWGGTDSPLNPTGITVTQSLKNRLWDGGRCTSGNCTAEPIVSCTPSRANRVGQDVSCTTTYYYSSLAKGNPFTGFGDITNRPFTITETARSETGFK